jgi:dipeptidyl-peptidase III
LTLYRKFHGDIIREAHWKGRQLILRYLTGGGEDGKQDYGISIANRDGNYYVVVDDETRVRKGLGDLLEKVQVIKSTGDKEGAEKLFDRYGTRFDKKIQENMVKRAESIKAANQSAFVFPHLKPVVTRRGKVTDVRLVHDEDLTSQHLRFSRLQMSNELD